MEGLGDADIFARGAIEKLVNAMQCDQNGAVPITEDAVELITHMGNRLFQTIALGTIEAAAHRGQAVANEEDLAYSLSLAGLSLQDVIRPAAAGGRQE